MDSYNYIYNRLKEGFMVNLSQNKNEKRNYNETVEWTTQ